MSIFRQMNTKCTSLTRGAFDSYMTAMGLGNVLDDGQAETGTSQVTAAGLIDAVETLKKSWQMIFGDAVTLVRYPDYHL